MTPDLENFLSVFANQLDYNWSLFCQGKCQHEVAPRVVDYNPPHQRNLDPVVAIFAEASLVRRDLAEWRMVNDTPTGEINGIPASRGLLVATNGVECLIRQGADSWFLGHYDFFRRDRVAGDKNSRESTRTQKLMKKYE